MVKRFRPARAAIGAQSTPRGYGDLKARRLSESRAAMGAIIDNFKAWVAHLEGNAADVLYEAMLPTFEKAKLYTPKKDGDLVASGYLEKRTFRGNSIVEIGFGKGNKPFYAIWVHEKLEDRHAPPTRAKYLQSALEEDEGQIRSLILAKTKEMAGV